MGIINITDHALVQRSGSGGADWKLELVEALVFTHWRLYLLTHNAQANGS